MKHQSRRNFLKKASGILGVSALSGLTAACGGTENKEPAPGEAEQQAASAQTGSDAAKTVTIEPVDNEMKYATTEIRAKAGTELTVVMNNVATSPAMHHNVVVLQNQEGVKKTVGTAAMQAKENDFIPPEHEDLIVAHTPMAAPEEETETTFTVPPAGEYPYICTYPGHWRTMQGTLISEA